jgi:hypothetical protein
MARQPPWACQPTRHRHNNTNASANDHAHSDANTHCHSLAPGPILPVRGDPRTDLLQPPPPQANAPCGVVELLDFPMDRPHGWGVNGGQDFGVFHMIRMVGSDLFMDCSHLFSKLPQLAIVYHNLSIIL